ncbi:hypothetical protein PGRAN_10468 [Listeria grandensis FSL F6-0971]|uniref:Uncharacterized protein n=1 Tax=Listeria grandensis FSL F6-0971 TaxID=1265819 RepID=W7B749_9LIST|nr:hypothetical protein [Listeria grandensis]EUJ23099.1 hypothetical protein PGRAN_10468 [Listeria grandensis FSL F6-0971]
MIWQIVVIAIGIGIFVLGLFYSKRWHENWSDGGGPDFDGWDSFFISIILGAIVIVLGIYVVKSMLLVGGLALVYAAIWVFSF